VVLRNLNLKFRRMTGSIAICRLPADASTPAWAMQGDGFNSITRTADELSIVCPLENVPEEHRPRLRWTCFRLEGPLSFSEVGVLSSFISPLAEAGIPIFAVSTYETDYVLVQEQDAMRALTVLKNAGHEPIGN
jgi:hypothetical protein